MEKSTQQKNYQDVLIKNLNPLVKMFLCILDLFIVHIAPNLLMVAVMLFDDPEAYQSMRTHIMFCSIITLPVMAIINLLMVFLLTSPIKMMIVSPIINIFILAGVEIHMELTNNYSLSDY